MLLYTLSIVVLLAIMTRKLDVPATERQMRLINLRHEHFVSQRALNHVADEVQREPLAHHSRASQYRARKALCNTQTPFGPLMVTHELLLTDGTKLNMGIAPPLSNLYHNCLHSPAYAQLVRDTLRDKPSTRSTPWHFILYQDEADPSDGLAPNHSRKSAIFYSSFMEFGSAALGHEQAWACPA